MEGWTEGESCPPCRPGGSSFSSSGFLSSLVCVPCSPALPCHPEAAALSSLTPTKGRGSQGRISEVPQSGRLPLSCRESGILRGLHPPVRNDAPRDSHTGRTRSFWWPRFPPLKQIHHQLPDLKRHQVPGSHLSGRTWLWPPFTKWGLSGNDVVHQKGQQYLTAFELVQDLFLD